MSERTTIQRKKPNQVPDGESKSPVGKEMSPPPFTLQSSPEEDIYESLDEESGFSPEYQEYKSLYGQYKNLKDQYASNEAFLAAQRDKQAADQYLKPEEAKALTLKIKAVSDEQILLNGPIGLLKDSLIQKATRVPEQQDMVLHYLVKAKADALQAAIGKPKMPGDGKDVKPGSFEDDDLLRAELAMVKADLIKLETSGGRPDIIAEVMRKHAPKLVDRKTEMSLDKEAGVSGDGMTSQKGTRKVEKDGKVLLTEDDLEINTLGANGKSNTKRKKIQVKDGDDVYSQQTDKKVDLDWWEKSRKTSNKTVSTKEGGDGRKESLSKEGFTALDASGFTWGNEDVRTDTKKNSAEQFASDKSSTKIERGDGKMGLRHTKEKERGALKPDGTMGDGMKGNATVGGHALLGPNGVGFGGDVGGGFKKQDANGKHIGSDVSFGGKMMVSVKDMGGNPKKYAVIILVARQASFSANAGKESGGKGVGVKGGFNFSNSYTIRKIMGEDEKNAYLKTVKMAEGGKSTPTHPELGIITTMGKNGGNIKQAVFDSYKSDKGIADRAKDMSDGEGIDLSEDKGGELGGNAKAGPLALDLKYAGGRKKDTQLNIVGGNAVLEVHIASRSGWSGGAGVDMKFVKGGAQFGSEKSAGKIVRITIPKNHPLFPKIAAEVGKIEHEDQLHALKAKYPEVNIINGTSKGESGLEGANIETPIIGLGFNSSHGHSQKEYDDGSAEYKGNNNLGGFVSLLGMKFNSGSKEELNGRVDAKGNANVDLSNTDTSFDLGKTGKQFLKNLEHDPLGLLTGGAKTMQESSDSSGTFMANAHIDQLIQLAKSKNYDDHINSPTVREEWKACVRKIRAAGQDRKAAVKALSQFVGEKRHGKTEAIESMLEASGHRNGGARYEFPDGTEGLKPGYYALLNGNPAVQVQALLKAGKPADAKQLSIDLLARIKTIKDGLEAAEPKFEDKSRLADMLIFLGGVKAQLGALQLQMNNPKAKPADIQEAAEQGLFQEAMRRLETYKTQESAYYGSISKMMEDGHVGLSEAIERGEILKKLDDLYLRWDDDYAMVEILHQKHGFGGADLDLKNMDPNRNKLELSREGSSPGPVPNPVPLAKAGLASAVQKVVDRAVQEQAFKEAQAKRDAAAKARKKRQALVKHWVSAVKFNQAAAGVAMEMCNGMNARKQEGMITSGASAQWGKAFAHYAKGSKGLQQLQAIGLNGSESAILKAGRSALSFFQQSIDTFKRGNQIQQYGG